MDAHALETAQEIKTLPLDAFTHHFTEGADEEEAGAVDFAKAFAMGSTGAGIGGAVGTVIPGLGNVAGGVIGAVAGAGISIVGDLLKSKKPKRQPKKQPTKKKPAPAKPAPPISVAQKEVMSRVKTAPGNPFAAADAVLMTLPSFNFAKAHGEGRLPSQVAARPSYGKIAEALEAKSGADIRKELDGFTAAERAVIGAALPAGLGAQARAAILAIRKHRAEEEAAQEAEDRAAQEDDDVAAQFPTEGGAEPEAAMAEAPIADKCARTEAPLEHDFGGTEAPTLDRPAPAYHVQQTQLPKAALALLLASVPEMWKLPRRTIQLLAGTLPGGVRDTAGIDADSGEFVPTPHQTLAGIAAQLTGDQTRTRELRAANPLYEPGTSRLRIPPSYGLSFVRLQGHETRGPDPDIIAEPPFTPRPVTVVVPEPDPQPPTPPKAPSSPATSGGKDSARTPTDRSYVVKNGETPSAFAKLVGALSRPKWWSELKGANAHKRTKDGGGNFERYYAGEVLNYPATWPTKDKAGKPLARVLFASSPPPAPASPSQTAPEAPAQPPQDFPIDFSQGIPGLPGFPFPSSPSSPTTPTTPTTPTPTQPTGPDVPKPETPTPADNKQGTPGPFGLPFGLPEGFPTFPQGQGAPAQGQGTPPQQPAPATPPAPQGTPAGGAPKPQGGAFGIPGLPPFPWETPKPNGEQTPSTQSATTDPGVLLRTQAILAYWSNRYPNDADPTVKPPFGKSVEDLSNLDSSRSRATLKAWQVFYNKIPGKTPVRVDGVLDQPTYSALDKWFTDESAAEANKQGSTPAQPSGTINTSTASTSSTSSTPSQGSAGALALAIPAIGLALSQFGF